MTAKEAAQITGELEKFIRKELPGNDNFRLMIHELKDTFEHMALGEPDEKPMVLGNLMTGEVRSVDSRDWKEYGVEWMDDAEKEHSPDGGKKGGARRDGK